MPFWIGFTVGMATMILWMVAALLVAARWTAHNVEGDEG